MRLTALTAGVHYSLYRPFVSLPFYPVTFLAVLVPTREDYLGSDQSDAGSQQREP